MLMPQMPIVFQVSMEGLGMLDYLMDKDLFESIFRPFFDSDGLLYTVITPEYFRMLEWEEDGWSDTDNEIIMLAEEILNEF
jgi:hypothetical protein